MGVWMLILISTTNIHASNFKKNSQKPIPKEFEHAFRSPRNRVTLSRLAIFEQLRKVMLTLEPHLFHSYFQATAEQRSNITVEPLNPEKRNPIHKRSLHAIEKESL